MKKYCIPLLLCVLWAGFIFWLSSRRHIELPNFDLPFGIDKWGHAGLYFVLCGLVYFCFRKIPQISVRSGVASGWSVVIASVFGMTDEWHQSFVPGRSCDANDWVADTLGASLFLLIVWIWCRTGADKRSNSCISTTPNS